MTIEPEIPETRAEQTFRSLCAALEIESDAEFLRRVFRLVLSRDPEAYFTETATAQWIKDVGGRRKLVTSILHSDEAAQRASNDIIRVMWRDPQQHVRQLSVAEAG